MATIIDRNGRLTLQVYVRRRRRTIALGDVTMAQAKRTADRVESLISARRIGAVVDRDTCDWLATIDDDVYGRLVTWGLCEPRQSTAGAELQKPVTLGEHLAGYVSRRNDVKPATFPNWSHTRRNLIGFFSAGRPLVSITDGDARDFERHLKTAARKKSSDDPKSARGLSPPTVCKRITNAKQFFADAVDRGLIGATHSARSRPASDRTVPEITTSVMPMRRKSSTHVPTSSGD